MARKKPKFEYAIICDDIREEMRKKLSFIGIYGPNILVSKIPFVFPKLCFAISYKDVKGGDSFSIELKNPSDEQLGKIITGSVPKEVKDNIITLAWHMPVSFEPKLYAIAIGKTRFSAGMINKSKAFVVNFVPFSLKDKALVCGTKTGAHIDKFEESGLTKEESDSVDCARIKEALGYMECEVVNEVDCGDHTIYIGKVLHSNVKKDEKRLMQKDKDFVGC